MSQIATTIEQSKRLMEAGLDPRSADMMWAVPETFDSGFDGDCENTPDPPASLKLQRYGRYCDTPAWSLSRLIDIHRNFDYGPMDDGSAAVIDCLVRAICYEIKYETGRVREEFIVKRPLGQPQKTKGA